jgi:hypothetical protein
MRIWKERYRYVLQQMDKQIGFIATVIAFMITYYVNPLGNIDLTSWNRTFSSSVVSGISIDSRIANFYLLFLLVIPIMVLLLSIGLCFLFYKRTSYKRFI